MKTCPWCGAKVSDITTLQDVRGGDKRRKYLCHGPGQHEYREGDGPDPDDPPLIVIATH